MEEFSVYNNRVSRYARQENPLQDLYPDDNEHGWSVARNLLKPLNHLEFIKSKEALAKELNLHNQFTPSARFNVNYELLTRHQAGKLSTAGFIGHLASQLREDGKFVSESDITEKLCKYATVQHMEFHPSDVCNLTCHGCTYGHDNPDRKPLPINFPFGEISKISRMRPRSMVVIGGGEPTLYRNGKWRFQDVIDEICHTNKGITLALVTNGTYKPVGDWPNQLCWIRLSLDAANPGTYLGFRGKPLFEKVIQNYLDYLEYDTQYVGISFLYAHSNIHDYARIARLIFELVKREKPHVLHKVNIQYRPMRRDPYLYDKPFTQAVTTAQVQKAIREVRELADSSREMKTFIKNQTNITAILGGSTHPPHEFSRCYYSQTFRIVRANGELRPCFIRVSEPDFILGNIKTDSLETIALNTLFVGAKRKQHCDGHGCRQCHVNYTFEQGLIGNIKPSTSPEVMMDPMY